MWSPSTPARKRISLSLLLEEDATPASRPSAPARSPEPARGPARARGPRDRDRGPRPAGGTPNQGKPVPTGTSDGGRNRPAPADPPSGAIADALRRAGYKTD